jgi:hypothetical protein
MKAQSKCIRHFILILIVFVGGGISALQAAGLNDSSIQTTGSIKYPSSFKIGIYTISWNFNEYAATTIADNFDMSQSWWVGPPPSINDYSAKMDQVHALNPEYKFLVYRNVFNIYGYWPDEWSYADSQGWLLKDVNGDYVVDPNPAWYLNYVADIANPSYQQWVASVIKSWLDQYPAFDGVMADNALRYSVQEFDASCKTRPINPRTGTYFTATEILDGYAGLLNAIIDAIGTDKLLVPNGIWAGFVWGDGYKRTLSNVTRLNGLMSEGAFRAYNDQWYSETDWLSSINMVIWVQNNFLSRSGRSFTAFCTANPLPTGATTEQVIMYGFSSMLLSTKYSSPQNTICFNCDPTDSLFQKLRNLDMIEPLGDFYKINSTSVYARDFVKGKVLVNPSSVSYLVSLNGNYTTLDGNVVSGSLTVNDHTGVILLK